MAKLNGAAASKEKKSKKRKLSTAQAEDEDSAAPDINSNGPPKSTQSSHLFKSQRQEPAAELDTSKPSAVFKPKQGRDWTLSIALPGSFIANTTLIDQKYELAGRIARAAAIFCVDEIVVFDDAPDTIPPKLRHGNKKFKSKAEALASVEDHKEPWENPDQFLSHNLEFLECPAHLRTYFFPQHPNLKGSGKLPPLDMPHHMRAGDWCQYREGVSLGSDEEGVTMVDCGLSHPVTIGNSIPEGARVTVKFADSNPPRNWPNLSANDISKLAVQPTTAEEPREEAGYYWGYTTRKAHSLSAVFQEHPFPQDDGYDFSIGTSERGVPLSSIIPDPDSKSQVNWSNLDRPDKLPQKFKHLLVVFGGVAGLEPAVASDPVLKEKGLTKETAHDFFDWWVNLVPGQGSRTIRTEEAVLLGLMGLRPYVDSMS